MSARWGVVGFASAVLAACATPPPRVAPDVTLSEALRAEGVSLVVDGCVFHDNAVQSDYVVVQESYEVSERLQSAAAAELGRSGIRVKLWTAPFACGSLINSLLDPPLAVAQTVKDTPKPGVELPHVRHASLAAEPQALADYLQLMRVTAPVLKSDSVMVTDYVPLYGLLARAMVGNFVDLAKGNKLRKEAEQQVLMPDAAQRLSKRLRGRYLLVGLSALKEKSSARETLDDGAELTGLACVFMPRFDDCLGGARFTEATLFVLIDGQTGAELWTSEPGPVPDQLAALARARLSAP